MTGYAELQVTSNYSFLRGASYPQELINQALDLGLSAIAVTDRNSLAGVVKAYPASRSPTRPAGHCAASEIRVSASIVSVSSYTPAPTIQLVPGTGTR